MAKYAENHIVFDKTMEKYPDSLFLDSDHLNLKGSEKFTKEFIKHIDELALIQK